MAETLVVGGSGGIGGAIVRAFAEDSDVLFTYMRARDSAQMVVDSCATTSGLVKAVQLDVRDDDALAEVVASCGPSLRTVIFAVASGTSRELTTAKRKHWAWTLDVNARAFGTLYRESIGPLARNRGALLTLTSPGGRLVLPDYALVGVSKSAMETIVRYAAVEAGRHGVRVNALCPGVVETKALDSFPDGGRRLRALAGRTPLGRFVTPDEVARIARWLAGPDARMITGQSIVVDGGWSLAGPTD